MKAASSGGQDPWSFAENPYELNRYQTILRSLGRDRYACVYEPGCAVGVLTQALAALADHVIAVDFAPSAVAQTRLRCAQCANVELLCADVRAFVPVAPLDLIVMSEVGYYFETAELTRLARVLADCLVPGGELVAAHWLGNSADHVLHGDEVHETLRETLYLRPLRSEVHPGFRLDSWTQS